MRVDQGANLRQRFISPMLWSLFAAVAIYGGTMILSDLGSVTSSVAKLGITGWAFVLGLSLVNYGLRFVRWQIYLVRLNGRVPGHLNLAYYIGGFAFTTTPGKAGEAVRSLYLKRHGVGYVQSLAAFFTERLIDVVAMVLLALAAAMLFPSHRWPVLIVAALVISILPLIHAKSFHDFIGYWLGKIPSEKLRSMGSRLLDLLRSASTLLRSTPLYAGCALALVAWGAEGFAFHLILKSLEIDISLGIAIGIYSVSILVGALSFIPGGLGSTEATMVLLLTQLVADTATAVGATLICRVATLWFAVILGVIVLAGLRIKDKPDRRQTSAS